MEGQTPNDKAGRARLRGPLACLLVLPAALALTALPAFGSVGDGFPGELPSLSGMDIVGVLGDDVVQRPDGLFEVSIPGGDLLTHGPDPASALGGHGGGEVGFRPGDAERPPRCATDSYQHVLYGRLESARDRYAQVAGEIRAAVRRMNAVLNRDSVESGGVSADYKVRCDSSGEIAVGSFTAQGTDFASIVQGARAAGFDSAKADYTIFFDGVSGVCGMGSYVKDQSLAADNASNTGGGFAVAYRDCWFTEIPMHENAHAQGAVQHDAPNSTGSGGHCNDEQDVMCYSPDGGDRRQGGTVERCEGEVRFDCGNDDYFDAAPEPGEYLATHWNLGSRLNRFIAFGDAADAGRKPRCRSKRGKGATMRRRAHDGKRACRVAGKARTRS